MVGPPSGLIPEGGFFIQAASWIISVGGFLFAP